MQDRLLANSVISQENFYAGTPCWEWIGKTRTNRNGTKYPYLTIRLKKGPRKGKVVNVAAHRLSLKVFKGRVLSKKIVGKHLCNNTVCINPEHLAGGSQSSNLKQAVREGRLVPPQQKTRVRVDPQ